MAIALGSTAINKLWLGATELKKVFHGDTLIYDKTAAPAAFPVVAATNSGGSTSSVTSYAVPLPASIAAGNLLIITITMGSGVAATLSTPSGWTELYRTAGGGNLRQVAAYWKVASGSEGSTVTVSASQAGRWATTSYRITGYQGSPQCGTTATGNSSAPNPPSLTPSWGTAKTLFIATMAIELSSGGAITPPTNYTNQLSANGTIFSVVQCQSASARRELEAGSDDPGAFALSGSGQWGAQTIAVRPA